MAGEGLPLRRCVADTEPGGVSQLEPPFRQERAGGHGAGAVQPFGIKIGGGLVRCQQPPALAVLLPGHVAALLVPELDTRAGRQPLDRLREGQVVDLLDELDDVAAIGAGEAVPQAAGRGDVEGGGLLVMERAQPLQRTAARAAQLEVLADDLIDG